MCGAQKIDDRSASPDSKSPTDFARSLESFTTANNQRCMHAIEMDIALGRAHPEPDLSQRHQTPTENQNLTLELRQRDEE
jgi:hypothetical protein